jgi:cell volume regulation protein A
MAMHLTTFFGLLGGLLVLAFVANRLARHTGVPDVLVLMATGIVIGPVLGWVKASQFTEVTQGFGTLALILILFQAGLELDIRETLRHVPGALLLAILSYGLSLSLVAEVARVTLGLPFRSALIVGAVVGCLSSSVILPVLQQMELSQSLRITLIVEASLADALAVLTVGALLGLPADGHVAVGGLVSGFFLKFGISLLLGVLAGVLWSWLLPILAEEHFWHVLTLAAVLLVYAGVGKAGGNDLFAVLIFGMTLSNSAGYRSKLPRMAFRPDPLAEEHNRQMLAFHSELGFLIRTFFFVLIGVVVEFAGLRKYALVSLGILGTLFLARWLAVEVSSWTWSEIRPAEREIAMLLFPRGLITAVLALKVVEAEGAAFGFLPNLAFAIILLTNLLLLLGTIRARRIEATVVPADASEPAPSTPTHAV